MSPVLPLLHRGVIIFKKQQISGRVGKKARGAFGRDTNHCHSALKRESEE